MLIAVRAYRFLEVFKIVKQACVVTKLERFLKMPVHLQHSAFIDAGHLRGYFINYFILLLHLL